MKNSSDSRVRENFSLARGEDHSEMNLHKSNLSRLSQVGFTPRESSQPADSGSPLGHQRGPNPHKLVMTSRQINRAGSLWVAHSGHDRPLPQLWTGGVIASMRMHKLVISSADLEDKGRSFGTGSGLFNPDF